MLTEKAAMYSTLGISKEVFAFGTKIEEELKERFAKIDEIAEYNQLKVIHAMQASKVSEACLYGTTGYGYNDLGRDTLEQVYATCFGTEDALVRPQIACGTHALATALSGNLRPGDELLSPVGKPYDTLEEVIGIRPSVGSLAEYGVTYRQVDLKEDGSFDFLIEPEHGADVRAEVFKRIVSRGKTLLSLTSNKVSLEQIFLRLTEAADNDEAKRMLGITEKTETAEKPSVEIADDGSVTVKTEQAEEAEQ